MSADESKSFEIVVPPDWRPGKSEQIQFLNTLSSAVFGRAYYLEMLFSADFVDLVTQWIVDCATTDIAQLYKNLQEHCTSLQSEVADLEERNESLDSAMCDTIVQRQNAYADLRKLEYELQEVKEREASAVGMRDYDIMVLKSEIYDLMKKLEERSCTNENLS